MKRNLIIAGTLSLSLLSSSCLGSFNAFNNLKDWNMQVSNSKFVNNAIFWGLNIVPVYGLFFLGDALIFNVLEFWTGSNPIAMAEGETETQIANVDGQKVKMTAQKNQFKIEVLEGEKQGKIVEMVYTPENKTWNAKDGNKLIKLASFKDGFYMVYTPGGDQIKLDANASQSHNNLILNQKLDTYQKSLWAKQ
ncbi:DUF3332 domain-containing protein [Flavobacterium sp. CS20]|jgi:hypothetical protein|uniref:DUF3332 domain-containing protein n=1 Tax=Flavobacterium sp. CS20 TaxID=2775246 RepID=UPI001B39FFCF|nr:DUF3332 domain-containing protein [Flavobacterium sp. CS20]QTY26644.1 DUF3332 domain-containing protein [Flavobacterium sp. CS20]